MSASTVTIKRDYCDKCGNVFRTHDRRHVLCEQLPDGDWTFTDFCALCWHIYRGHELLAQLARTRPSC